MGLFLLDYSKTADHRGLRGDYLRAKNGAWKKFKK